jgi:hypothetical protein
MKLSALESAFKSRLKRVGCFSDLKDATRLEGSEIGRDILLSVAVFENDTPRIANQQKSPIYG